MVRNFRFEKDGRLALSGAPQTGTEVDWLAEQGIRGLVSLHPVPEEVQQRLLERGITWRPFLIEDFSRGVPLGLRQLFEWIDRQTEEDPAALIH